jgi:hypothetical protein
MEGRPVTESFPESGVTSHMLQSNYEMPEIIQRIFHVKAFISVNWGINDMGMLVV